MTSQLNPRTGAPAQTSRQPISPPTHLRGPSVVECAELSEAIYSQSRRVAISSEQGTSIWQRGNVGQTRVGFFAARYTAPGCHDVIAIRGSQDAWDFLVDDLIIAGGGIPPQLISTLVFARQIGMNAGTYFTGHSLGGGLAVLAAAHFRKAAVSFNAPGVNDACMASTLLRGRNIFRIFQDCALNPRVENVRIEGDLVSSPLTTGLQVGSTQRSLSTNQCGTFDALCRHGMGIVLGEVRANPEFHRPLNL